MIRIAQLEDLEGLLEIYNYEVEHGVATFDRNLKTLEEWRLWFDSHNVGNHPLIVAEKEGRVAGYASLSSYRDKEAYEKTVELSVYIHPDFRRQGIAKLLMEEILSLAKGDQRIHTVVSVITKGNLASEKLHDQFGFQYCGCMKEVGEKFGMLLDIVNYQLLV